jgi:gliding motility-associated-like protein
VPIISYDWNATILDTASFFDFPDSSSWYTVEVINSDDCIIKDSTIVNVYDYPVINSFWASDTVVFKGENINLNVIATDNISWDNFENNNHTQQLVADISMCYYFEVSNQYYCTIRDSICVTVLDVFCNEDSIKIPTAFSPNEDEFFLNETYFVDDMAGVITKYKLEIFNRLGQKIFSSTVKDEEWDGTYKGEKLSPQVFDFYLELECIGGKTLFHKGNITLIR